MKFSQRLGITPVSKSIQIESIDEELKNGLWNVYKMNIIEKCLGDIQVINCDVEIEKAVGGQNKGEIYRAEVNLEVPRKLLRVEKTEDDLYKAIDKVKDHLELVIKKYKEKIQDKNRGK